jgi:acetolactate synthase-1/2/3 large subunit
MSSSSTLMSGARMLLECLAREGVDCIFGYPGGVTLPFYDVLYDHHIRHILVRHEENAAFAAAGYARATGKVGVCCATSGPGATNLTTGLVDAMMDSIPIVALTGQVPTKLIGSDAFQEADTFGITRPCTKHNYLVKKIEDLPQVIHEAFYIAASGRPGPVLVDVTKDVFQGQGHYQPVNSIHLPGYKVFTEGHTGQIRRAAQMIQEAERPLVYAGGGIIAANASKELREFVELTDTPAVNTLMGLGALPSHHPNFISMPGMHGSYAANMGMSHADVLIALGVRFDDRVTGRLAAFAPHAKVIHVDIDPAEVGKNRTPDVPIVGDVRRVLTKINKLITESPVPADEKRSAARRAWWKQIRDWKEQHPLEAPRSDSEIKPQHLMTEIDRLSGGQAIVTSDVGQHQMWAAQLVKFNEPRLWINSGGLGSMGFGLPAAIGAQFARPDKLVF